MSDESRTDMRPRDPVLFEHWCEQSGCNKWGGFGYDIGRSETKWFCFEHEWRDYRSPKASAQKNA